MGHREKTLRLHVALMVVTGGNSLCHAQSSCGTGQLCKYQNVSD